MNRSYSHAESLLHWGYLLVILEMFLCYGIFVSFRENPHESLGNLECQNRAFHFQIPQDLLNFAA